MEELLRTRHGRLSRFLLELVGWPVAPAGATTRRPPSSHQHAADHGTSEHLVDPVCATCGARHGLGHPPRGT